MKRLTVLFLVCVFATLAPAAFARQAQSATPSTTQKPTTPIPTYPRTTHMTTDPALLHPATLTAKAPETFDVKFTTTKGDFVVQVTRAWAPLGADRFYNLVKHGFFSDAAFFRVVPGFIIQFGLSADPAVNKVWRSANIKDDPSKQSNKPGYVTFATAGPNTRTTQLFINFGNNTFLDSQGFTPFGQVTSGMDMVQKLYSGYGERPDQGSITTLGKPYLDKNFPDIDSIKSATIVTP
jgi:peptidyl-prolyl cis-trans isomerase A (cyclophilin A)